MKITLGELLARGAARAARAADPVVRDRLAQLYIESEVLRLNALRGLSAIMRTGVPGPEGSLGKWQWADVNQALTELAVELRGPGAPCSTTTAGPTASCAPARTRSRAGRPRSSRTSSPSACSDCRGCDEVRARRRPAGDPADRQEFLASRYPAEEVRRLALEDERGFTDEGWRAIAELGWPALVIGEDDGGLGLGVVELAVLQEQLGYALAPTPLLSTFAAALAISAAGDDEQRAQWLPAARGGRAARDRRPLPPADRLEADAHALTARLEAVPDAGTPTAIVPPRRTTSLSSSSSAATA